MGSSDIPRVVSVGVASGAPGVHFHGGEGGGTHGTEGSRRKLGCERSASALLVLAAEAAEVRGSLHACCYIHPPVIQRRVGGSQCQMASEAA